MADVVCVNRLLKLPRTRLFDFRLARRMNIQAYGPLAHFHIAYVISYNTTRALSLK